MTAFIRSCCITLLILVAPLATGAEPERVSDLRQQSSHQVLLLLVSQPGCGYCDQVKEEVILPMIKSGLYVPHTLIQQIVINNGEQLIDYQGQRISATDFARRYDAWATPTLLFLDHKGRELAPKMIGFNTPEYYGYYVDRSLEQARGQLLPQ